MKVKFARTGCPLYCDIGPHAGDMLIEVRISQFLSPQEYARYHWQIEWGLGPQ